MDRRQFEMAYVNDQPQGTLRTWHENGRPKELADGVNGKYPDGGPWFSDGSVRDEFDYDKEGLVLRRGDPISVYLEKMATLLESHPKCSRFFPAL